MKALIINGSPKGNHSNTIQLANAFTKGMQAHSNWVISTIDLQKSDIHPCIGCFSCWTKTPGKCIFNDDMSHFTQQYLEADVILWSIPLYFYGMPSKSKAFLDRLLPLNLPFIEKKEDGRSGHPSRYDMSNKRYVLLSTCGFSSRANNYEALIQQFDIMYGKNYEKILCPEGELFTVPELSTRVEEYLTIVTQAGSQFAAHLKIDTQTKQELEGLLLLPETFAQMANAHWEILELKEEGNTDISYPFMKQMQAIFNPANAKDIQTVIQMTFTDIHKTYQLIIKDQTCTLVEGTTQTCATNIETPFALWQEISAGKIDGTKALMEGEYRVLGDLEIMTQLDSLFGA